MGRPAAEGAAEAGEDARLGGAGVIRSDVKYPLVLILLSVTPLPSAQTAHEPVPDVAMGKRIFESQCSLCHGQTGGGGRGPSLARPKLAKAPDDEALRKAISEGLPPEMPGAWQLSIREVASVAAYVRSLGSVAPEVLPGNAGHGASLYQAKGCSACHIVGGEGTGRGPELTSVGARRNGAYLRESIVRPEADVADGYLGVEIIAADGRKIRGTLRNEDPFTIQVADMNGAFHSFRKAELKSFRRLEGQSTMPAFAGSLTAGELDDLVAYLANLRGEQ